MTFDIMLPFYGDVTLLRETVRSVQAQEDGDWQLTVVDDCYPDESVGEWFAHLPDDVGWRSWLPPLVVRIPGGRPTYSGRCVWQREL